jgi:hypothetical protein
MTTFSWDIAQLQYATSLNGFNNVVTIVHWSCTGVNGTVTDTRYSSSIIPVDFTPSDFTPYENLTKEQVLEWVWKDVPKEVVEAKCEEEIQKKLNEALVNVAPPWLAA